MRDQVCTMRTKLNVGLQARSCLSLPSQPTAAGRVRLYHTRTHISSIGSNSKRSRSRSSSRSRQTGDHACELRGSEVRQQADSVRCVVALKHIRLLVVEAPAVNGQNWQVPPGERGVRRERQMGANEQAEEVGGTPTESATFLTDHPLRGL